MAIFNRKYLLEGKYISKFADDVKDMDDDDKDQNDNDIDEENDDDESEEKEDKEKVEKENPDKTNQQNQAQNNADKKQDQTQENKPQLKTNHLTKDEIDKCIVVVKAFLSNYPKLKKCCDYIDLSDKENINDEGQNESEYDRYYNGKQYGPIKIINGEVWGGYPNFRQGGSEDYDTDTDKFVKDVNGKLKSMGIPGRISLTSEKDDEAVEFSLKSIRGKE